MILRDNQDRGVAVCPAVFVVARAWPLEVGAVRGSAQPGLRRCQLSSGTSRDVLISEMVATSIAAGSVCGWILMNCQTGFQEAIQANCRTKRSLSNTSHVSCARHSKVVFRICCYLPVSHYRCEQIAWNLM